MNIVTYLLSSLHHSLPTSLPPSLFPSLPSCSLSPSLPLSLSPSLSPSFPLSLPPSLPLSFPLSLLPSLSPRCYQKLGDWKLQLEERTISGPVISPVHQYYHNATEYDRGSHKAWHALASMNFQALLEYMQPSGEGCGQ